LGLYEKTNLFDGAADLFMLGSARLMQFMLVLASEPSMHLLAFPTITFMGVGEQFYLGITFAPEGPLMQSSRFFSLETHFLDVWPLLPWCRLPSECKIKELIDH
jgi:hypothetical protein